MDSVVITGVSTGIGLSAAEILCESGYKVFGSVRKIEDAKYLSSKYSNFKPLIFDVRDESAIQDSVDYVKNELSNEDKLVGLVNNSGIALGGPFKYLNTEYLTWKSMDHRNPVCAF